MQRRASSPKYFQKSVLDGFLAGGQHQFQLRAVLDLGANGPGLSVEALHVRQAHVQGEAVEVEVRLVVGRTPGLEHGEREAVPVLDAQGAVEKIVPFKFFAVERHPQGCVTGGGGDGRAQGVQRFGGVKRHARAAGRGCGLVG